MLPVHLRSWQLLLLVVSLHVQLATPDENLPLALFCDASIISCGAFLVQLVPNSKTGEDELKVVGVQSKIFNPEVSRQAAVIKEYHGLLSAFRSFEYCIRENKVGVVVLSDCLPLVSGLRNQNSSVTFAEGNLLLSSFPNVRFIHTSGILLRNCDILSRLFTHGYLNKEKMNPASKIEIPTKIFQNGQCLTYAEITEIAQASSPKTYINCSKIKQPKLTSSTLKQILGESHSDLEVLKAIKYGFSGIDPGHSIWRPYCTGSKKETISKTSFNQIFNKKQWTEAANLLNSTGEKKHTVLLRKLLCLTNSKFGLFPRRDRQLLINIDFDRHSHQISTMFEDNCVHIILRLDNCQKTHPHLRQLPISLDILPIPAKLHIRYANSNVQIISPLKFSGNSINLDKPIVCCECNIAPPIVRIDILNVYQAPYVLYHQSHTIKNGGQILSSHKSPAERTVLDTMDMARSLFYVPGAEPTPISAALLSSEPSQRRSALLNKVARIYRKEENINSELNWEEEEAKNEILKSSEELITEEDHWNNYTRSIVNQVLYLASVMTKDYHYSDLFKNIQASAGYNEEMFKDQNQIFLGKDGVWYEEHKHKNKIFNKILIPDWALLLIARSMHSASAHFSPRATNNLFNLVFSNKNIMEISKIAFNSCAACLFGSMQNRKTINGESDKMFLVPGQDLSIDYLESLPESPQGHKNIMVVVDRATNYVVLLPQIALTQAHTLSNILCLMNIFPQVRTITTDGSNTFGGACSDYLTKCNIRHIYNAPRPQSNGLGEQFVKQVSHLLRVSVFSTQDDLRSTWPIVLPTIARCINSMPPSNVNSPYPKTLLFFNQLNAANNQEFDLRIMEELNKIQEHRLEKMKYRASLHKLPNLELNQFVLVKKNKLELNPQSGLRSLLPSSSNVYRIIHLGDLFARLKNVVCGTELSVQRSKLQKIDFETMINLQIPVDQYLSLFKQNKYIQGYGKSPKFLNLKDTTNIQLKQIEDHEKMCKNEKTCSLNHHIPSFYFNETDIETTENKTSKGINKEMNIAEETPKSERDVRMEKRNAKKQLIALLNGKRLTTIPSANKIKTSNKSVSFSTQKLIRIIYEDQQFYQDYSLRLRQPIILDLKQN